MRQRVEHVRGTIVRQRVGMGTKSERDAVVIVTHDAAYALRRSGANAFQDEELERLIGSTVEVSGLVTSGQLIADRIDVLDD